MQSKFVLALLFAAVTAQAGDATTVGTFKKEDLIFEAGASAVGTTGIQKSSADEQGVGAQMSILFIGKGDTGDVRFAGAIGKVMDRMIGNIYMGGWTPRKEGTGGGMDTSIELNYQTARMDVFNAGLMIPTSDGGTLKLVALLASLHVDRDNAYVMNSQGVRITFEQEIGDSLRAYAGGIAAILYSGDESAQSDAMPYAIVLTKPGVRQEGVGSYYQGHVGFATKVYSHVVLDASLTAEKTSYRVYEYGLDDSRLSDTEERGSFAVTGRLGAAVHF